MSLTSMSTPSYGKFFFFHRIRVEAFFYEKKFFFNVQIEKLKKKALHCIAMHGGTSKNVFIYVF